METPEILSDSSTGSIGKKGKEKDRKVYIRKDKSIN